MNRMSRVGRQRTALMVVMFHDKKNNGGCLTTGQIAKKMGIKSSTYLKNILRHMAEIGLIKLVQIEPRYQCGYFVDAWQYCRYEQASLPNHTIVINGQSMRMYEGQI